MVSIVRPLTTAIVAVAIVIALVALLIGLIAVFQERVAFQPPGPPHPIPGDARRVNYSASDGQQLFAYLVGTPAPNRRLLIAFHGNADMAGFQVDWAKEVFNRTGIAVLITEYRGYSGLPGKPTYVGTQADAEAAYTYTREILGVNADQIAYFGHSLGSAVATELATRHQPYVLILESPFTSARDMAKGVIGRRPSGFMWNLVSRIHYDTVQKVKDLDVPVSVAHGAHDRLIPPTMGDEVFQASKKKGEWLLVPEASHNDVSMRGGEDYWSWITRSLTLQSKVVAEK